jgi:hypothetical protein
MTVPQILTLGEVAEFLGVGTPAVASWAREGLPACARSEGGELLFYRWRVERDGLKLAASEVVRFRKANSRRDVILHDGRRLPCGCVLIADGDGIGQPAWLCPDARALQSIERLTAAVAAAVPDDLFFCRLSRVTADALTLHLAPAEQAIECPAKHSLAPSSPPEADRKARVT